MRCFFLGRMVMNGKLSSIILALSAALFYALNIPFSKILLQSVSPTFMAAFLYLGAGTGIGITYLFKKKTEDQSIRITKKDFPYVFGMVVLDIFAPILLMLGLKLGSASNASLLSNFEIVATTIIALALFKEKVSKKLWLGILFIVSSSIILSLEETGAFSFSIGSLFVILATCCWGFENNCTRKISNKSTYQVVTVKGIFSGLGSLIIAMIQKETPPQVRFVILVMLLGFVSYGMSIFMYVRAQQTLGAAKTSAYYAVAPFVGAIMAFFINGEKLSSMYFIALFIMLIGSFFVVSDTLLKK